MAMPAFFKPDLTSNGVLAKAATDNGWGPTETAEAKTWYDNFLQAAWNAAAAGTSIKVLNRKADALWHVHKDTHPEYEAYCKACFGKPLNHISVASPHAPSATELAAVKPYYGSNWPIPDSFVACST